MLFEHFHAAANTREAGAGYIADRLMTDTVKEAKKITVPRARGSRNKKGA